MPRTAQNSVEQVQCPFSVVIDSREQRPFDFSGLRCDADQDHLPLVVPTRRIALPNGDYSLLGMPRIAVERKSLDDLYGSVTRRVNFEGRLRRMQEELDFGAVVIEAEWSTILRAPAKYSHYPPKSLFRTVVAWMQRYPRVHWMTMPDRWAAEQCTFQLLRRYWIDHQQQQLSDPGLPGPIVEPGG